MGGKFFKIGVFLLELGILRVSLGIFLFSLWKSLKVFCFLTVWVFGFFYYSSYYFWSCFKIRWVVIRLFLDSSDEEEGRFIFGSCIFYVVREGFIRKGILVVWLFGFYFVFSFGFLVLVCFRGRFFKGRVYGVGYMN